jgi:hypothetical protein
MLLHVWHVPELQPRVLQHSQGVLQLVPDSLQHVPLLQNTVEPQHSLEDAQELSMLLHEVIGGAGVYAPAAERART